MVDFAPTAVFSYDQPCDPPGFVYFNDSSYTQVGAAPITEWLWEIEPGYFSSEISPTYTFDEFDTCYVVHLTVTDANGCENHFSDSVCIVPPLVGDFQVSRVCNGEFTFFESFYEPAEDTILSYKWNFGDGTLMDTDYDTISYQYALPGLYYATLTMENQNGCEKVILHEVSVDALPGVDFSFTPSLCDQTTFFTDLTDPGSGASITSYLWDFGDPTSGVDNTSTEKNPFHNYAPIDSAYLVKLIVTNSHGCVDSIQQTLVKGLCMQAVFEVSTEATCNNTEVCFADSSYILGDQYTIQSWQWAMGDGQIIEYSYFQDSICHTYDQPGEYMVTLIVTSNVGTDMFADTTSQMISISAVPQAEMSVQSPCAGSSTSFFDISDNNGVEITSWQWDFGDPGNVNDTSSRQNPGYVYPLTGVYSVQLITENINGCTDTILSDIQVFNNPMAGFSSSLACAGGMTLFTDESVQTDGELSYWLWNFGTGETSGAQNAQYVYADTGNYLVEMIVTDQNLCRDTTSQMLSVFAVPLSAFEIIDHYEDIQGQILLDNFSEGAVRYVWDMDNGDTSELFSPVVRYEENGTYLIQLISWNDMNCPDTAYMEYTILFQGLYVPTGFTPTSNDPSLKLFKPVGRNLESYEVTVLNQHGIIMWHSTKLDESGSPLEGWDGTTEGEPQSSDTYIWKIKAKFRDGTMWTGNKVGDGNTNTYGLVVLIR